MFNHTRFFSFGFAGLLSKSGARHFRQISRLSARLVTDAEQELLQGKAEAADNILNLALTADPGNARAFFLKGQAQTALGNKDEGLRLISVGLEIEPGEKRACAARRICGRSRPD